MQGHLVNHIRNPEMRTDNTLHVIGVISNPARWHSRLRLFRTWRDRLLKTKNVKLYVVEGVYGDHHPECAPEEGQDYAYACIRLHSELWLKENMINYAAKNLLPRNWNYMCWEDCDVEHEDPDWALKTITALQTYNVVQTWSHGLAFDPAGGVLSHDTSFGYLNVHHPKKMSRGHHQKHLGYEYAHTGYSWACTRFWWENLGGPGLIDFCLIGSGDHHMAWAMLGRVKETIHGSMSPGYFEACLEWQRKAHWACGGRIGYAPGLLKHSFHGPRRGRNYIGRWVILVETKFNPKTDLAYDAQGILYLIGPNKHIIETHLISYNRDRIEDSIERE